MKIDGVEMAEGDKILFRSRIRWRHHLWAWLHLRRVRREPVGIYVITSWTGGEKK